MLKILGAGLPRTGTATLCEALRILGYDARHHEPERLPLFPVGQYGDVGPMLCGAFDGIDAITDCPAALYWRDIYAMFRCKVILTVRDTDCWWESIKRHANLIRISDDVEHLRYTEALHSILFGVPAPCEFWYKRKFAEHANMVKASIPRRQLLVMDIVDGDKWGKLCPFLGVDEPDTEWPWENRRTDAVDATDETAAI